MKRKYAVLGGIILLFVLLSKHIATFFSTIFLILQIFPQAPFKPLEVLTREPKVDEIEFSQNSRIIEGKLFIPEPKRTHPALILALAVKTAQKDEPQIDNFAKSAARMGFVVLIPHSRDLQEGLIKIEDKDTFVGAFEFLSDLPWVDPKKISFVGISAGSSIALKATLDPKIADLVRSVLFFGGYFDAKDYFSSLISGKATYKGNEIVWQVDPGAIWHAKEVIISLAPEEERAILASVLHEGKSIGPALQSKLSAESKFAISAFSPKQDEFGILWEQAPESVAEHIARLSPSDGIENLKTRLFILHDRGDRYVSYTESRKLNDALPADAPRNYLEVSLFEHVQPKKGISPAILLDFLKLYLFAHQAILFLS